MIAINEYLISKENKKKIIDVRKITHKNGSEMSGHVPTLVNSFDDTEFFLSAYNDMINAFDIDASIPMNLTWFKDWDYREFHITWVDKSGKKRIAKWNTEKLGCKKDKFSLTSLKEMEKSLYSKPIGIKKENTKVLNQFAYLLWTYITKSLIES